MSLQKWYDSNYLKKAIPTASDISGKLKVAKRDLRDTAIRAKWLRIAYIY
ncbi:MAG: hypothetical protein KAT47_01540 [Candidatus Aegiribacteria sp.]|nr:hypothetical protein [Candidatus Aegiribacteria sp.]